MAVSLLATLAALDEGRLGRAKYTKSIREQSSSPQVAIAFDHDLQRRQIYLISITMSSCEALVGSTRQKSVSSHCGAP